jgi:hypothetical protein
MFRLTYRQENEITKEKLSCKLHENIVDVGNI